MRLLSLTLLFLLIVSAVHAQNYVRHDSIANVFQSTPIKVSYLGDNLGVKPGFNMGIEHTFRSIEIEKIKKSGKIKLKNRDYFYGLNLTAYQHTGFNSAIYLHPEIGFRKTKNSGFYTELSLGTGWMHTTLGGPTYTVDNMGNVNKVNAAGSDFWAFNITPGLGWDFSKHNNSLPLKYFIKPSLVFQYPYNGLYLKHIMMETGFSYSFSNFLESHTKTIYRKISPSNSKK